jgi:hypothetical protein
MIPSVAHRVIGSIFAALAVLDIGSFALRVYMHIREGVAANTYDNVYGFHIMWSQAAVVLVGRPE